MTKTLFAYFCWIYQSFAGRGICFMEYLLGKGKGR